MEERRERSRYPQVTPEEYLLEERELANNGSRRMPVTVCVDCSYSMRQRPYQSVESRLDRVMDGLKDFCREMNADPLARDSVELCLISFGGEQARVECDFTTPDRVKLPKLVAEGGTPLADAVALALENLEQRKRRYQENGISYYRPWLLLIGDGNEKYANRQLEEMARKLKEESDEKHLHVLCVIVGDEQDVLREMTSLKRLSPDGKLQYLRDLKFGEFFGWLSRSIQKTSQSMSGEEVYYEAVGDWAEILGG